MRQRASTFYKAASNDQGLLSRLLRSGIAKGAPLEAEANHAGNVYRRFMDTGPMAHPSWPKIEELHAGSRSAAEGALASHYHDLAARSARARQSTHPFANTFASETHAAAAPVTMPEMYGDYRRANPIRNMSLKTGSASEFYKRAAFNRGMNPASMASRVAMGYGTRPGVAAAGANAIGGTLADTAGKMTAAGRGLVGDSGHGAALSAMRGGMPGAKAAPGSQLTGLAKLKAQANQMPQNALAPTPIRSKWGSVQYLKTAGVLDSLITGAAGTAGGVGGGLLGHRLFRGAPLQWGYGGHMLGDHEHAGTAALGLLGAGLGAYGARRSINALRGGDEREGESVARAGGSTLGTLGGGALGAGAGGLALLSMLGNHPNVNATFAAGILGAGSGGLAGGLLGGALGDRAGAALAQRRHEQG